MESSLRAESSHLRITARLIRVRDQVQIWSDSFDRTSSILGLQQEISSAIAEQVRTRLSPDRQRALRGGTQNAEAYDFFLRGRHFLNQRTPEAMQRAIESFSAGDRCRSHLFTRVGEPCHGIRLEPDQQ